MSKFVDDILRAIQHSWLCVGLDPEPAKLPLHMRYEPKQMLEFCCKVVDATHDLVCAFKPQIAYFAAEGAEAQLEQLIAYIHQNYPGVPVILDAKRGDIGSTAAQYAREAFERYRADAVTLSPYLGFDSIEPYLRYQDKGLFLLCRTSNPSGGDLQNLLVDGQPLYQQVAKLAQSWDRHGQIGLVVGATYPEELQQIRALHPDLPLLIPGIGAQGGDLVATVKAARHHAIINSSRAILYASDAPDFAQAARQQALQMRAQIQACLQP